MTIIYESRFVDRKCFAAAPKRNFRPTLFDSIKVILNPMQRLALIWICSLLISGPAVAQENAPDVNTLQSWVQAMKKFPRGPFKQIRWFCNDGTVQLPQEYACKEHDGGVQHGEWTRRVRTLRANGYHIANVLADIRAQDFMADEQHETILKQILLEKFLIEADNGWIFRRARYYRGALQAEDEARSGRALLLTLVSDPGWQKNRFLLLREAVRFIPHGHPGAPITEMRQLSRALAETDGGFESLRTKLHVHPEAADAQRVREYAGDQAKPELTEDYVHLAEIIEAVFRFRDIGAEIRAFAKRIEDVRLAESLRQYAEKLSEQQDAGVRFLAASHLLADLRDGFAGIVDADRRLAVLDISLLLESELFRIGNVMLEHMAQTNRRERLSWLATYSDGLYGIGLISARQHRALQQNLAKLMRQPPQLIQYKAELEYSARVPQWADRALRFHFGETVDHFAAIEPLSHRYIHDRLRGSLLLSYTAVLESLLLDANRQFGIRNFLFGRPADSGLRGLNAGLARGRLRIFHTGESLQAMDPSGIYVLPATTEDLPQVAGILTTGEGNILSHIQLLARNLGIPNVAFDKKWLPHIKAMKGQQVVMAVSPRGVVQLAADGPQWNAVFEQEPVTPNILIRPDVKKLDLNTRSFIDLANLRTSDSGRICGPKAANLGELKRYFPEAVTDGLVIPFGMFRELLDRPMEPGGLSAFRWMQDQYKIMRRLEGDPKRQDQIMRRFLKRMQTWIVNADPGQKFRDRLRAAMEQTFGPDGTYGVFVRSDTNVEDLPGFTGAGLNLTVPHVVGFEQVMSAIARVWASPFSERAFRWRQAYMEHPEHVYTSVLLMKSVPAEKSGVLVTADIDSGQPDWLTITVSEGVGGAVSGQTAEELRIHLQSGEVRLMAQATEPYKRVLSSTGGIKKVPASGAEAVLNEVEIRRLKEFARTAASKFPGLRESNGRPVPADVEFGFYQSQLILFQIRPFLESVRARKNLLLNGLDSRLIQNHRKIVNLTEIPAGEGQ
jgi:phosphohistidine swiveling domain-containing protein